MNANRSHTYFPALDGLRALAALLVLWTHIERYKQSRGRDTLTSIGFNSLAGGLAVTFFFVLSGFLITYLLLQEQKQSGSIRTGRFLRNRLLRIAPLYFLTIGIGYPVAALLLHQVHGQVLASGLLLNLLFLPNIAFAYNLLPEILIQVWSIGTELQFYLLWPFLLRKKSEPKWFYTFLGIILFWALLRYALFAMGESKSALAVIVFRTRFDCMAIGGILAMGMAGSSDLANKINLVMDYILRPGMMWILGAVFAGLLLLSQRFHASFYPAYAILFACMIYRQVQRPWKFLSTGLLAYAGRISYGIYLLHHFCVYVIYWLFQRIFADASGSSWNEIILFAGAALLVLGPASLSYFYFEKKFLAMKASSGNAARS